MSTTNEGCCEKCWSRGKWPFKDIPYCIYPECPCHKKAECSCGGTITRPASHSPKHCKATNDLPSIKKEVEKAEGWKSRFDEKFGSGDESGDYTSTAIKAFIAAELTRQREELAREVEKLQVMEAVMPGDTPLKLQYKRWLNQKLSDAAAIIRSKEV